MPLLVFGSLYAGGYWPFNVVCFTFVLLPLLELVLPMSTANMTKLEEAVSREDSFYDGLLYLIVPLQYGLLFYFLWIVTERTMNPVELIGCILAFGIACGAFGINVAHELGHRKTWYEQWMSKALLLTSLNTHFFIEHNRGHHLHVSTHEDPASARRGEWLYFFWFRSMIGEWINAWKLEFSRLKKEGKHPLHWSNAMAQYQIIQVILCSGIAWYFGLWTMVYFIIAAIIGILLLETIQYIEHYGLRRARNKHGSYEKTRPVHSWNSNHPLGRILLFELTRHSDHHYIPSRKYQILRHFDESPQLPAGYPGSMLLSLFPPLFFWVMHPKIDQLIAKDIQEGKPSIEH